MPICRLLGSKRLYHFYECNLSPSENNNQNGMKKVRYTSCDLWPTQTPALKLLPIHSCTHTPTYTTLHRHIYTHTDNHTYTTGFCIQLHQYIHTHIHIYAYAHCTTRMNNLQMHLDMQTNTPHINTHTHNTVVKVLSRDTFLPQISSLCTSMLISLMFYWGQLSWRTYKISIFWLPL